MNYSEKPNKLPLVSIGIPTYNNPNGLWHTLRSITKQTYENIEIIISDNHSQNDEVEKVAYSFAENDPRVHYFKQKENIGSGNNFRFVFQKANGDFFLWASDDDDWAHDAIEKYMSVFFNNQNINLAISNVEIKDLTGQLINCIDFSTLGVKRRHKYIIYKNASFNLRFTCWIYGIFRREYLKKIKNDISSDFGWDYIIIMREILQDTYGYISLPLFKYTSHQVHTSIRYKNEEIGHNYGYKWRWTKLMVKLWVKNITTTDLNIFDKIFASIYLIIQLIWSIDNDIGLNISSKVLEKIEQIKKNNREAVA